MKKHAKKMWTAAVLSLLIVVCGAQESTELLKNGDFEDGFQGWNTPAWFSNPILPVADADVNQGPGCGSLKFVGNGTNQAYCMQGFKIPAEVKHVKVSGWMKTQDFQNSWAARIQIAIVDAQGKDVCKQIPMITPTDNVSTDWTKYSKEIDIPENGRYIRVILLTQPPVYPAKPNNGTVWFDNISVTAVPVERGTGI